MLSPDADAWRERRLHSQLLVLHPPKLAGATESAQFDLRPIWAWAPPRIPSSPG